MNNFPFDDDFSSDESIPNKNPIGITPFAHSNQLCGFLVSGRWPVNTLEWLHTLIATVRTVSVPGLLPTTTVFSVREDIPENASKGTIGLLIAEYTFNSCSLSDIPSLDYYPTALFVLHPPEETTPSLPEYCDTASGCMLLPGLPHLGLEHRAGWAEARHDVLVSMHSKSGIDPSHDPDTAVMAMLLSA